ncbi:MAG: endonuclease [Crocinitomicaceae bacterium]|nr:endonuclease [Crocinitomicaceae bacterium]
MKKAVLICSLITLSFSTFSQTDIADARTFGIGQTVTVTGIATNGSELGSIRYMQDATAGIAGYGGPITGVNRYDSITVTGPLIEFSGLLEISFVTSVTNHGPAVIQPIPLEIPFSSANESLESQLVKFQNVTFISPTTFASGNSTVQVTDGVTNFDIRINGSTNIAGTAMPTGPVTITGMVGQYNTNYQLVPRDLNDIVPYVAPAYEINVLVEGATVLTNGNYFVGNNSTVNLTVENLGSADLSISGYNMTGVDAVDFSSTITSGTIAGSSNQAYTVNYSPSGTGSHFATIEIESNDVDENPYIINFEGAGTDNLATEPMLNPSGLTFPLLESYTLGGQYNAGSGASKYLVLWKNGTAITGVPVDGESYQRGDVVGDAKVAYVGAGTSFTPRGIVANQDYYFAVYAFNGLDGFENYLTTSPATGSVTSLGEDIGSYYNGVSSASPTFVSDLNALINPHTMITYFLYKQTMMSNFEIKDTLGGQSYVTCALSGERMVFDDPFDWTATGYSREHTFAHSWMTSWPANNPEQPEYNDQHNLYPANLAQANTPRSNLPLGDIDGNVVFTYLGGRVGLMGSQMVYEPREVHKGNAARSIMYMAVAYGFNLNGNLNSDKQTQEVLKDWHFNDLPDNYEIARHEYIHDLQGNRNPFIDSVDYACFIDFDNNAYNVDGCQLSLEEQVEQSFVVFPVPSSDKVYIQVNGTEITAYTVLDAQGRKVLSVSDINAPVVTLNASDLNPGTYLVTVDTPYGEAKRKMIVQ